MNSIQRLLSQRKYIGIYCIDDPDDLIKNAIGTRIFPELNINDLPPRSRADIMFLSHVTGDQNLKIIKTNDYDDEGIMGFINNPTMHGILITVQLVPTPKFDFF